MTRASAAWGRRAAEFAAWVLPGAAVVLMPKCPACVAAYVALGTGIGLSVTGATYLRAGVLGLCAVSLVSFAVQRVWAMRAVRTGRSAVVHRKVDGATAGAGPSGHGDTGRGAPGV